LVPHFVAKICGMKKPQEFYVMPDETGGMIVESDNYIGRLDKFGNGVFSRKGHWIKNYIFPQEFVNAALNICPAMGKIQLFDGAIEL
jgi:hypothetical protein